MITIKEAEEILQREYNTDNFRYIIQELLIPDFHKDVHEVRFNSTYFDKVIQFGESKKCEVVIYEVYLNEIAINKRVGVTQEMFKLLRQLHVNNSIVSFVNPNKLNYRLSLLTSKYVYEGERVVKILSNPRRFSYALGIGTKTKTPYKFLISKGVVSDLEDLISRFSVEVVNRHFYSEIARQFTKLIGGQFGGAIHTRQLILKDIQDNSKYAEFAVRLIGRLMFCWFLKEKKSSNNQSLLSDLFFDIQNIENYGSYYHQVLEPLFFELLNTNINSRDVKYDSPFYRNVPYLNGGLFSPHSDDFYRFSRSIKSEVKSIITIPNQWFIDFYVLLNEYNFTVDENTTYDIDLSIDPEMLGRIFENLLAEINPETGENAKKSTGSFYTPREIVDFMVDRSLCEYLCNKTKIDNKRINSLLSYSNKDENLTTLSIGEKELLIDALFNLTVLDPACGSGAFPIGVMQKIVFVLQQLDPDASMWFKKSIKNVPPMLRREIESKFSIGSLNYIRKLSIIQNSIFGIDIQPIAVEISRLRCFLSLIIEENVLDNVDNRGIHSLPNLDFKFIIANSLIGLDNTPRTRQYETFPLFENQNHISELKEIRDEYFSADYERRTELKIRFMNIQQNMLLENINEYKNNASKKYFQLSAWKPFSNETTDWFDSDWMFGLSNGFDIVIGNPPYISAVQNTKGDKGTRNLLRSLYPELRGAFDLYAAFLSLGVKITNSSGCFNWIVPNKLLVSNYAKDLMSYLIGNGLEYSLSLSDIKVFENVGVYPIIILGNKHTKNEYKELYAQSIQELSTNRFDEKIKMTNYTTLKECGVKIGSGATGFQAKEILNYISETYKPGMLPFVVSGNINPYSIDYYKVRYMGKTFTRAYISKGKGIAISKWNFWSQGKIIIAGMTKRIEAIYCSQPVALGVGIYGIYDFGPFEPKFLTCVLNSKYITFYLRNKFKEKHLAGGYLAINKSTLDELPIIETDMSLQLNISLLYDEYIRTQNPEILNTIDDFVYRLYRLEKEEIERVEKCFVDI